MRWLVTGAHGMLGTDLVDRLRSTGEDVTTASRASLDLTAADAIAAAVDGHDVVVNCAAWTAVDDAEEHEEDALAVNGEGPRLLARAAATSGARIVQVSTDYVFDGAATAPYAEDAPHSPVSAYAVDQTNGQLELLGDIYDSAPYGYVVAKDQTDFAQAIADAVKSLIDDGTYETVLKKWGVEGGAITDPAVNPAG